MLVLRILIDECIPCVPWENSYIISFNLCSLNIHNGCHTGFRFSRLKIEEFLKLAAEICHKVRTIYFESPLTWSLVVIIQKKFGERVLRHMWSFCTLLQCTVDFGWQSTTHIVPPSYSPSTTHNLLCYRLGNEIWRWTAPENEEEDVLKEWPKTEWEITDAVKKWESHSGKKTL